MWYSSSARDDTYANSAPPAAFSTECGAVAYYTSTPRRAPLDHRPSTDLHRRERDTHQHANGTATPRGQFSHGHVRGGTPDCVSRAPPITVYHAPREPHRAHLVSDERQPSRTPSRRCATPTMSSRPRPDEVRQQPTPRCGHDEENQHPRTAFARTPASATPRPTPLRTVFVDATANCSGDPPPSLSFATQVSKDSAAAPTAALAQQPAKRSREDEARAWSRSAAAGTRYHLFETVVHPRHKYVDAPLLPYRYPAHRQRHLLLLDLDETLVHASAQEFASYDACFSVDMDSGKVRVFVKHRPFLMELLQAAARHFEVGVFTASLSKYADQVLDHIDPRRELITHRLFREHCTMVDGNYVKDLGILGREMNRVMLMDNSPVAYLFHPQNAIPCTSWFDDEKCNELQRLIPVLVKLSRAPDVVEALDYYRRVGALAQHN